MIKKMLNIIKGRQKPDDILARMEQSGSEGVRKRLGRLGEGSVPHKNDVQAEFDDYIWTMTGELQNDSDIQSLVASYQAEIDQANATSKKHSSLFGESFSSWFKPAAALAGAAALLAVVFYSPATTVPIDTYATRIGDQRIIELADASKITLNTNTQVRVQYSDDARDIYLDRGEAIFSVEKDKKRPFNVYIGDTLVRAVGTEFNIFLDQTNNNLVTVSVLEGIVTILNAADDNSAQQAAPPLLEAGNAVSITNASSVSAKQPVDLVRIAGWRSGQIVFHDISLDEAVKDHNRYAMQKIVLGDRSLASERISGTFKVGDSQALLFALENLLDVEVQRSGNTVIVSKQKS